MIRASAPAHIIHGKRLALTPGTRLGPYEILSAIGAGGMGEVYRARDTKLNRDVALKILPDAFASDPDRMARFTREAQTLAALNHPNIAHVHGLEESSGVRALVMELVEGEDLAHRIARGAIPLKAAVPIARQIAEALDAAHEKDHPPRLEAGQHQDYARRDGQGSRLRPREGDRRRIGTRPHAVAHGGSRWHSPRDHPGHAGMSPEQARGQAVDKRTDIWAFGCVLYEMLTGRAAFARATVSDTIAAILEREPDWHALVPDSMPAGIKSLLQRSLEKDVRRRLRDIGDALLLLDLPVDATAQPPSQSAKRRAVSYSLWIAGVAVLAAAVAATMWMSRGIDCAGQSARRRSIHALHGFRRIRNRRRDFARRKICRVPFRSRRPR